MCVLVRMQFHNHVNTRPVKRFERAMRCIYHGRSKGQTFTEANMLIT